MPKFNVIVSRDCSVWEQTSIQVEADTPKIAEVKALNLAEEMPDNAWTFKDGELHDMNVEQVQEFYSPWTADVQ